MCRISGIINKSQSPESLQGIVKEMCNILRHGGPDGEGIYSAPQYPVVLGHRRLSLIDLTEAGHQPMSYAEGRYQISFNGEIYNYKELKEELKQAGFIFKTNSDTEVILAGFAAWGTASFSRLNGMFSFALWDNLSADLYLVRDSMGIKPLYYAITKEGLAFASEIRGFAPISYLQEKNEDWQIYMMAYSHIPEPITILKHVMHLPKGAFIKYHVPDASYKTEYFITYNYTEKISNRSDAIEMVRDQLKKAVNRHMISDAPIGVFLSGGLDSSIIALLAGHNGLSNLSTISLFFENNKFSEKKYQDSVQQKLKGNQHQHLLTEQEFHLQFPSLLNMMDQPSCDGINTWFISKYAKQNNLKAVLSGIGGDELFGGYPSFNRMSKVILLQNLPDKILNAVQYSGSKRIRRMAYLSINSPIGKYLFLRGQFVPTEIAKYLDATEKEVFKLLEEQPQVEDIKKLSPKNQASWIETNFYMQNQLLRDADVMSMAHGIEIRVPFLDKDFVSLMLSIKSDIKYSGAKTKQLLIDSFKDILPESVWNRPKMGFSFPFKDWLANDEFVKDKMSSNGAKYYNTYQQFIAGKIHWSQLMTSLLLLQNFGSEK